MWLALAHRKQFGSKELDRILITLGERAAQFFTLFGASEGRTGFRSHEAFLDQARRSVSRRAARAGNRRAATGVAESPAGGSHSAGGPRARNRPAAASSGWKRATKRLRLLDRAPRPRDVPAGHAHRRVATARRKIVRSRSTRAILTSATLAVAGEFEFTKQRLGLRAARTLVVPSHFDYNKQALLYVPQNLPDPRSPAFTAAAAREIIEILTHSRGRAFVLFTSYQQMRLIYDRVSLEIPYQTLLQGTGPRSALLEEFRATPQRRAVRDLVLLAGRGRAGRTIELRYHR